VSHHVAGLATVNCPDQLVRRVLIQRSIGGPEKLKPSFMTNIGQNACGPAIFDGLKDALDAHTGEWPAVTNHARQLLNIPSHQGAVNITISQKTAESHTKAPTWVEQTRSRLADDGHNVLIKCFQDGEMKDDAAFAHHVDKDR
jgi:hypothetical protein